MWTLQVATRCVVWLFKSLLCHTGITIATQVLMCRNSDSKTELAKFLIVYIVITADP
jgi:hypothetical protein